MCNSGAFGLRAQSLVQVLLRSPYEGSVLPLQNANQTLVYTMVRHKTRRHHI